MGDIAYIYSPEQCNFCDSSGKKTTALYDGKTIYGPWAFMCADHFKRFGIGLGTGLGQRLIVGEKPSGEDALKESAALEVTRETQQTDVLYVTPKVETSDPECVFYTPDGLGRIWFDSVEAAHRETGIAKVVYLTSEPED